MSDDERRLLIGRLRGAIQAHYQAANHALIAIESLRLVLESLEAAKPSKFDELEHAD